MTEKELIRCELLVLAARRGWHGEAANELVAVFQRPVLYYIRRLVKSEPDAWDALQETLLSVMRALPRIREPRALPAFVYRTARNAAFVEARRRQSEQRITEAVEEEFESPPEDDRIDDGNAERVHRALETLPLAQREVLTLYFLKDLSLDEIAAVTGAPVGTIKSRLYYAKRTLRQRLEVTP